MADETKQVIIRTVEITVLPGDFHPPLDTGNLGVVSPDERCESVSINIPNLISISARE
jgi:hypothetical protein